LFNPTEQPKNYRSLNAPESTTRRFHLTIFIGTGIVPGDDNHFIRMLIDQSWSKFGNLTTTLVLAGK
jgi:hypothetical protein